VDITLDPLSSLERRPLVGLQPGRQIFIDVLDSIVSNKLSAVVGRSEVKDLIDLCFIRHVAWKESKKKEVRSTTIH
jgi:hypothetical protein